MPKRTDIGSILIIGSGPIVIGQACEFDYSGTQACKVLKQEGFRVILVNSNPATIMTDPDVADRTYIEPITPAVVEKIIEREKPDALLPTMGGQTALNVSVDLIKSGVLDRYQVEMIGAKFEAIQTAEDREQFKAAMEDIGMDVPRGGFVKTTDEAWQLAEREGLEYPVIIRPSYTLGGTGGGIAYNVEEYSEVVNRGLTASPISEVLIEESILGWKEFELEVMRDVKDNVVIVCSIENLDPMGVHTGDSITVAPAQTLSDKEYQRMRDASLKIIRRIGVETGGLNIQFAVCPQTGRMVVIEMNPRVSRSSALASKATGFPIAKIAARLAVGYTLDEIPNDITRKTPASFEPAIDYVVTKIPRWDFNKFPGSNDTLGIQMKSVGEVMAIGRNFAESLQKALRSLENGYLGFCSLDESDNKPDGKEQEEILRKIKTPKSERVFAVREALSMGLSVDAIASASGIDPWFLNQMKTIVDLESMISDQARDGAGLSTEIIRLAKETGFSDPYLAKKTGMTEQEFRKRRTDSGTVPVFKTVDTCAAEFEAETPYYYSTYEDATEVEKPDKKRIVILGGGPNRIGQGIEFDYCCVQAVSALRDEGYDVIMVNCNPETVSTDYDTSDRLYFEPLTFEDVMNVLDAEKPEGVIVQFGGQTPLKLALSLQKAGAPIIGTAPDKIDEAEDRKKFGDITRRLAIDCPPFGTCFSYHEAEQVAHKIGYPVLVRPSYVLGGRAMEIVYDDESLKTYMHNAALVSPEHPILIDKFLENATELDVDALYDGEQVFIGGIMEHIEEAGVHSGDSSCVIPPQSIDAHVLDTIREHTEKLARALEVRGLVNIQFAIQNDRVFVLEVNPRASRTVPFVSKATGVPLARLAARIMVGRKLADLSSELETRGQNISVKSPVLPFSRFPGARMYLGPEMKSTGEVMGISDRVEDALLKAMISAGNALPATGGVFISVSDRDKPKTLAFAAGLSEMGFEIFATGGTQEFLRANGIDARFVSKLQEGRPNVIDRIKNKEVNLVINTPTGKTAKFDERYIGETAIMYGVPMVTTMPGAMATLKAIQKLRQGTLTVKSLQEYHGFEA